VRRLELALDASQIGVWEHNLNTDELLWDMQMHRLYGTGRSERQVSSDVWISSIHPEDRERAIAEFNAAIAARGPYNSQFRVLLPTGDIRHIRSRAHFYEAPSGGPAFIGAEWDVTADVMLNRELAEQKAVAEARAIMLERSYARIEYTADHDYLTGLPNRRYFDRRFGEMCDDSSINMLAVVHIGIDGFKQINDKYGHPAGDALLRHVAAQLSGLTADRDMLARVAGDEFVVVVTNFADTAALAARVEKIVTVLRGGVRFGSDLLRSSVSVGVARSERSAGLNLLAETDLALSQAKKLGRNRVEFFTPELQAELQGERQMSEELRLALQEGQIEPYYQVQADAHSRQVVGLEALARWRHPSGELLSPSSFMKVAGDHGLIPEIDAAILRSVLNDRADWVAKGVIPPRIAVNISSGRLEDPQLVEKLSMLDIPSKSVVFELVETIFLDDSDETIVSNVDEIKRKGIDIEIDDFGSGHASLIGLVKLRPKRLKIDRQLVAAITVSEEQRRLIGSIVEIAHAFGVEVIAEGAETEKHARLLARIGCDILQGFTIGRPVSQAEMFTQLSSAQEAALRTAIP
jgi:diguanylate cyclase (GGDEF)-like protein